MMVEGNGSTSGSGWPVPHKVRLDRPRNNAIVLPLDNPTGVSLGTRAVSRFHLGTSLFQSRRGAVRTHVGTTEHDAGVEKFLAVSSSDRDRRNG